jgi:hypothetical protein
MDARESGMSRSIAELIERRFGIAPANPSDRSADGELGAILSHRTHRQYTDEPITEELLETVLAAGLSAPAKSDLQQVTSTAGRKTRRASSRPPSARTSAPSSAGRVLI